MIRVAITTAAYAAIATTLPGSVGVEPERAQNGDYHIWLEPRFVDRLKALRGPREAIATLLSPRLSVFLLGREVTVEISAGALAAMAA
jgi:hypothetical protein